MDRVGQRPAPGLVPAFERGVGHAQRAHHLGLGPDLFGPAFGLHRGDVGVAHRPGGEDLVEDRDDDQHRAAGERQQPEPGMEDGDAGEEDRCPGNVEHRGEHRRRQQPLHRFEIAQRVGSASGAARGGGLAAQHRREHPGVEPRLEAVRRSGPAPGRGRIPAAPSSPNRKPIRMVSDTSVLSEREPSTRS